MELSLELIINKCNGKWFRKILSYIKRFLVKITLPIIIIIIWQILYSSKIVTTTVFPSPFQIIAAYKQLLLSGDLVTNISISLIRVVQGFSVGALVGISCGVLIGISKRVELLTAYLIGFLRPIPMLAWIPVVILILGIGEESKVVLIAMGSFWPVLINVISGIKQTDNKYLEVAQIFEKSRFQILMKIILPSSLPYIFTGLRLGISVAWMCVIGAEMVAASSGIGYYIMYQRSIFASNTMMAGVFIIGIIGVFIDKCLLICERKLIYWNGIKK